MVLEVYFLEEFDKLLQILCGKLGIGLDTFLFLYFVDDFFKFALGSTHNYVREHLNKSSVAVISKSGIAGLLSETFYGYVVETEVEDSIHHTGHRRSCTRTYGYEEGILLVAEFLTCISLYFCECVEDFCYDIVGDFFAVVVVLRTGLGGDSETLRYGHTPRGHLGKVCALTAEQIFSVAVSFFEKIYILCHTHPPFLTKQINSLKNKQYC